jgi:hypothetical protein
VAGVAGTGVAGTGGIAGSGIAGTGGAAGGGTAGTGGSLALCGTNNAPDEGAACNAVIPSGPCPTVTFATGSPPAASGGQWVAGTYELTSRTIYNVPDGGSEETARRETVVVTGSGNSFTIAMAQTSGTMLRRQSGSVTTSGTPQFTFTPTCPPPGDGGDSGGTMGYTTDGSSISIYDTGDNGTIRVDVYTKR